jgi:hypothetical protein
LSGIADVRFGVAAGAAVGLVVGCVFVEGWILN